MIIDVISLLVMSGSLVVIAVIIGKKLHLVASIDVDLIPSERHSAVKNSLISLRLRRKFSRIGSALFIVSRPLAGILSGLQRWIRATHGRLLAMRHEYRKKMRVGGMAITLQKPSDTVRSDAVVQARELIAKDAVADAERLLIQALSGDSKNPDIAAELVRVYRLKKEFDQGCELCEYVCKLRSEEVRSSDEETRSQSQMRLAESHFDCAQLYTELGRYDNAMKALKKSTSLLPDNPKYLHELVELYIKLNMRLKAEQTLDKLRATNPDNQAVSQLFERIGSMSY
ncbi:MAG: tetratricopeptide repeat protein [Patescibacteria group bacterium]